MGDENMETLQHLILHDISNSEEIEAVKAVRIP